MSPVTTSCVFIKGYVLQILAYRRLLYIDKYASDEAHQSAGCRQRFSGRRVQQPVTKLTPAARRTPFLAWFFLASSVGSVGSVGSDYRALCSVGLHRRRPPWRQAVLLGAPLAISISLSDSSRCPDISFRLEQMPLVLQLPHSCLKDWTAMWMRGPLM